MGDRPCWLSSFYERYPPYAGGDERYSPYFVEAEFSEVPHSPNFVLWSTYISLIQEYAAFVTWPVDAA